MTGKSVKLIIGFCLWMIFFTATAISADNSALVAFARKNADKFKNEIIPVKGISTGTKVTVSIKPSRTKSDFRFTERNPDIINYGVFYDPESGEMICNDIIMVGHWFSDTCKSKGSYVGQNSFGVKAVVQRKACDFFRINYKGSGLEIKEIRVKMSPSQFRTIKKNGIQAEVDFTVGHPEEDITVQASSDFRAAEIRNPVELHSMNWKINGSIEELRWVLPDEKKAITIWKRTVPITPSSDENVVKQEETNTSDAVYNKGLAAYKENKYKEAYNAFSSYLEKNRTSPLAPNARFWLGECFFQQKEFGLAILEYQKVVVYYPKSNLAPAALYKQGLAFEELDEKYTAKIVYNKLLADYPNSEQVEMTNNRLKRPEITEAGL